MYASEHTNANILSLMQVLEDKYPIMYKFQDSFTVHLLHVDIVFNRPDGMYIADWTEYSSIVNIRVCTRAEGEHACKAYDLAHISG